MTDDDLTRRLEAWAAATDPAADPITATDVTAGADDSVAVAVVREPERNRRRLLAVAAVILVFVGLVGAVMATRPDDDVPHVVTDDGAEADRGPRTQIILDARFIGDDWQRLGYRFSLFGPSGEGATGAFAPGLSVVVDQHLAPGRWELVLLRYACGGTEPDVACGPPNIDGSYETGEAALRCDRDVDVAPEGGRIRVIVEETDDGGLSCGLSRDPYKPQLTVPPSWSVRPPLPWSCGNATFDADMRVVDDPAAKRDGFECFRDAVEDGTPVEIPVVEWVGGGMLARSWWRVLPEPIDGDRFEILRERAGDGSPTWVRLLCHSVAISEGAVDVTTPEGGITGYRSISATPLGCTAEEPLPLDLPPLDGAAPTPPTTAPTTTTTAPPAPGTISVVLDADLPPFVEGGARRWIVLVDGQEVSAGPLTESGSLIDETSGAAVQQVADDLAIPASAAVAIRIDSYDCYADQADRCRADHMGPTAGAPAFAPCTAEAPPERAGAVLVATLRADTCTAAWTTEPVTLTVPAAFTLRPASDECGDLGEGEQWGECLANAYMDGRVAERTVRLDGVRTTYLAQDGRITVFRRSEVAGGGVEWSTQTCATVEVDAEGRVLTPTRCEAEEPLPLG
jgi:hypothetical protein